MKEAAQVCTDFGVSYETCALFAHRTPAELEAWIDDMEARGCLVFIAGAGNTGLSVIAMLALNDPTSKEKLIAFRAQQAEKVRNAKLPELN